MYEERYAQEQKAKYEKAIGKTNITSGNNVLDVGCGTGLFLRYVAPKGGLVVGVDVSCKLLLKAKEQTKAFANVLLVQADADHLPFRKKFFDTVSAFTVLQNMPKPRETLIELKRAATIKGILVVTGLKKAFSLAQFKDILEEAGLPIDLLEDEEDLKCYIAVTAKS